MYRERRKYCGTLPHNVDDHETLRTLKQLPMYTSRREDFLCCCEATDDGGGFVAKSNLVTLCNADVITMDGTFRVCPKFFHQLLAVHGYLNGQYIPLVHCLLSNKATATYVHMLNTIQANCATVNLCFSPQDAVVDFEISMLSAVQSVLPNASVHCCRFHVGKHGGVT